jgi:hypothetical protein
MGEQAMDGVLLEADPPTALPVRDVTDARHAPHSGAVAADDAQLAEPDRDTLGIRMEDSGHVEVGEGIASVEHDDHLARVDASVDARRGLEDVLAAWICALDRVRKVRIRRREARTSSRPDRGRPIGGEVGAGDGRKAGSHNHDRYKGECPCRCLTSFRDREPVPRCSLAPLRMSSMGESSGDDRGLRPSTGSRSTSVSSGTFRPSARASSPATTSARSALRP